MTRDIFYITNEEPADNKAAVVNNSRECRDTAKEQKPGKAANDKKACYSFLSEMPKPEMVTLDRAIKKIGELEQAYDNEEVLQALHDVMKAGGALHVPVRIDYRPEAASTNTSSEYSRDKDITLSMCVAEHDGDNYYVAFTSLEDAMKGPEADTAMVKIDKVLEKTLFNDEVIALAINPYSSPYYITKDNIMQLLISYLESEPQSQVCFYADELHETDAEAAFEPVDGSYEIEAKAVIGVDNPIYSSEQENYQALYECYWNILNQADGLGYKDIVVANMGVIGGYEEPMCSRVTLSAIYQWNRLHPFRKMRIKLICNNADRSERYSFRWEIYNEKEKFKDIDSRIFDAALQAGIAHAMELYKGNKQLLFTSLEQMTLVKDLGFGTDMLLAALFCEAVNNELITVEELKNRYGIEVAAIAGSVYKEKKTTWNVSNFQYIYNLRSLDDDRVKLLAMAGAIVEMRRLYKRLKAEGYFWEDCEVPQYMQGIYYKHLLDVLKPFELQQSTEQMYQEYVDLYKKLFLI